ncbi:ABC transporter ATP-binding protein [Neogemmobacter tilapiae]|uniref:Sugar ABC transporter ATP-binding protein n=1 Tax=Neogemmobacter tilapiae TaxID=875041 RepID=A0A918TU63_9RHOB|nr:ABC transporter ATP-binding protein [Gemmobacter tilapiae]GHC62072.1 sugar ABC transporter ATP-binding protein [Gemmobacter tilapiae]
MKQASLQIDHLAKSYGAVQVLRDISVSVDPGGFLVLVGPSGCGKSTLLNCIAGLDDATAGRVQIAGKDVTRLPPRERDIAMVFQSYALYPTMTVGENIGFGMKIRRLPADQITAKVAEVARLLQIDHLLDRRPAMLSGGQRQRVAMGRALVRDPALFLFDEPLSNLDAKLRVEMRAEIKRLHQATGTTMVYVTHDQVEAMTLATTIAVLKDGILQQAGSPEDIYLRPANTFVADFMGAPPMNLIPAHLDGGQLQFGDGQALTTVLPPVLRGRDKVIVGIRPEAFQAGETGLQVTPQMVENTGSDAFVNFTLSGAKVIARLPARTPLPTGGLRLSVDPTGLCFFDTETGRNLAA